MSLVEKDRLVLEREVINSARIWSTHIDNHIGFPNSALMADLLSMSYYNLEEDIKNLKEFEEQHGYRQ